MIVQTVTSVHQFRQAFVDMGRKDQFSYDGLDALYEFLEDMSEDFGEPCELDVIAICCDFHEMSYDEALSEYASFFDEVEMEGMDSEEIQDYIVETLREETTVVWADHTENKLIIQAF